MKKEIKFTLVSLMLTITMLLHISCFTQDWLPNEDPLYELKFFDDFDSTTLDQDNWRTRWDWSLANLLNTNISDKCDTMDIAVNRHAPFNQGNWVFDTTGTGFVRMIYRRENDTSEIWKYEWDEVNLKWNKIDSLVPFKFTGAMMRGKHYYKYGYFEIRFRVTDSLQNILDELDKNAYGPNFWMYHVDTSTSSTSLTTASARYSELDIYEIDGRNWGADANIHFRKGGVSQFEADTFYHAKQKIKVYKDTIIGNDTISINDTFPEVLYRGDYAEVLPHNWHTMSCEWTEEYADFYYSSHGLHRRFHDSLIPVSRLIEMPLTVDNYVPAFQYCIQYDSSLTVLPVYYDIDYVKVYQLKQDYVDTTLLNTSDATYASKVYKSLTLGGTSGSAVFDAGKHHLCAEEYVYLDKGFEISGGAEVYISCKPYQDDQCYDYRGTKSSDDDYSPEIINDIKTAKTQ